MQGHFANSGDIRGDACHPTPPGLAYGLASIADLIVVAVYFAGGHKLRIDFSRYVVAATAQHYYFNTDLAKQELGDWKTVRGQPMIQPMIQPILQPMIQHCFRRRPAALPGRS